MDRDLAAFIALCLIPVLVVSSLLYYENTALVTPVATDVPVTVLWQRPIAGFASGVAAHDGKVFTVDIFGNISSYNVQNGASLWNSTIGPYFAADIAVANGKVYAGKELLQVACLDETTGKFQWVIKEQNASTQYKYKAPDYVIVNNGRLIVIGDGVSVYNASSAQLIWQLKSDGLQFSYHGNITDTKTWAIQSRLLSQLFEGAYIYGRSNYSTTQYIFKLDTANGATVWQTNMTNMFVPSTVIYSQQGYLVLQSNIASNLRGQIICVNDTTGKIMWSKNNYPLGTPIAAINNSLILSGYDGYIFALELSDGAQLWKTYVEQGTRSAQVDPKNNRIFLNVASTQSNRTLGVLNHQAYTESKITFNGTVCSLDLTNGRLQWSKQISNVQVERHFLNESFSESSSPVRFYLSNTDDHVFVAGNNQLWILGASTGNVLETDIFDHYILPPVKSGNSVAVAGDAKLAAYD